ncbi:MAG TPA: pyridoxamine 5'-phosphate oxidase family protein [Acidimicrobiia bacterium]
MGRVLDAISDELAAFLEAQPVFFVATAPADGHVNVSPKGLDSFRVLGPRTVAYLDLTGSGVETIAHLRDNGRITLMFCAFEGTPNIVRLYGAGEVLPTGGREADALLGRFRALPGARSVIRVSLDRISTSCGYGVPLMTYAGERSRLVEWAGARGADGLVAYRSERNALSIDGLPGLPTVGGATSSMSPPASA